MDTSEKEMNVVPYDPPYEVFARERFTSTRRCLQFDFQSLVGISESLAKKYSINSIKSLLSAFDITSLNSVTSEFDKSNVKDVLTYGLPFASNAFPS